MSNQVEVNPTYLTISALREFPTSLTRQEAEAALERSGSLTGWHESLLRSFQVLQKTKHLLAIGTPAEVVLEIIQECGE